LALTFVFFLCFLAIKYGGIIGVIVGAALVVPVLAVVTALAVRRRLRLW
jgi:hypothetical protein